jgi:hypothetical protein
MLSTGWAPAQAARLITQPDSSHRQKAIRWYLAPSAGLALSQMKLRGYTISRDQLFEPIYLEEQDLDRGRRLLLGVQGGLLFAGGRVALHTEHAWRRFLTYEQSFATGHEDFPTRTFQARGQALSSVASVRYRVPVRSGWVYGGVGMSRLTVLRLRSTTYYDGVSRREAYGFELPVSGAFMEAWQQQQEGGGYSRYMGLYFEAGAELKRFSITWSYRHTWASAYTDQTSVFGFRANRVTGELSGYLSGTQYSLRPVAFCWTAAYRLNR